MGVHEDKNDQVLEDDGNRANGILPERFRRKTAKPLRWVSSMSGRAMFSVNHSGHPKKNKKKYSS